MTPKLGTPASSGKRMTIESPSPTLRKNIARSVGARLSGATAFSRAGFSVGAEPTASRFPSLVDGRPVVGGGTQGIVVRALGRLPGCGGDVPHLDVELRRLDHYSARRQVAKRPRLERRREHDPEHVALPQRPLVGQAADVVPALQEFAQ